MNGNTLDNRIALLRLSMAFRSSDGVVKGATIPFGDETYEGKYVVGGVTDSVTFESRRQFHLAVNAFTDDGDTFYGGDPESNLALDGATRLEILLGFDGDADGIGIWEDDDGKVVVDLVRFFWTRPEALIFATDHNQKAIYDSTARESVEVRKLKNGATILDEKPTDFAIGRAVIGYAPMSVNPFVTWRMDREGHTFLGHYFKDFAKAMRDFAKR